MAVGFSNTNKPLNPRGQDASPKGYNRAKLFSGKALDFDGVNDSVEVGAEGGTYNDFTLVWNLKTSYTGNYQAVFSDGSLFDFYIKADGQFRAFIGTPNDTTSLPAINSGEWVNLVLTRSGSTGSFYYNGVLAETLTLPTSAMNNIDISIGQNKSSAYPFDGQIAGFKLFNTALTAAQVADLYNNPEKVVPTGVDNTALKLWLPMQEGAGTTAYDGSGNGNHGTISGATYTHGIGAPVAQTAVIDWNKGVNLLKYSENMVTGWTLQNVGASVNALESPDGLTTATKFTATAANTFHINNFTYASASAGIWKESVFAKKGEVDFAFLVIRVNNGADRYGVKFDLTDGTFVDDITSGSPTNTGYEITDAGNGWYKCTVQALHTSGNITNVFGPNIAGNLVDINGSHLGDGTSGMYFWGASLHSSTVGDSYVRTEATAQTSEVLLPQGLTTGRDITGVNLFENVRKQGALNLDGNSWAEVHDNASLDITSAITLEAWVYNEGTEVFKGVISKWGGPVNERCFMLYKQDVDDYRFDINGTSLNTGASVANGWNHLVGVWDSTSTNKYFYVNGALSASTTQAVTINTSDNPVEIGTYGYTSANSFNDQIAQPRIYNRALTAAEVLQNYNSGKNTYTNN